MRRATLAATITILLAAASPAGAFTRTDVTRYERAYAHSRHTFGQTAVGCRLFATCHGKVTDQRLKRSTDVLHRMFAPPPPPPAPAATIQTAVAQTAGRITTAVQTAASSGPVPACASESGTNYSLDQANTNPQSGATGRYQITPGTAANYGCTLATPAGQDQCAAIIYQHQGTSAWVGCGG